MPRLSSLGFRLLIRAVAAALGASFVVGPASPLAACNIPVFRYALERWHPDPYRCTVFHRGPLTEAQQELLRPWEESPEASPTNVALRVVDVDAVKDEADRALLAARSSPQFPWLVVQYPKSLRIEEIVWAGTLSADASRQLVGSPLRSELIRRLADGQTAVWLMLECGDKEKDAKTASFLEDELKQLAEKLKLPDLTAAPEDELRSDAPLKVAFSLLRVPRDIVAEQPLVEVLLHSEPDLVEFDEPMVFPVFGRGRALLPLIGAGITSDNIHESAAFLVGACSCEIKELNPGFDLLLRADWDELLFHGAPLPEVVAMRAAAASGEPELVAIPSGAPAGKQAAAAPSMLQSTPAGPVTAIVTSGEATTDDYLRNYAPAAAGVALLAVMLVFALRR